MLNTVYLFINFGRSQIAGSDTSVKLVIKYHEQSEHVRIHIIRAK